MLNNLWITCPIMGLLRGGPSTLHSAGGFHSPIIFYEIIKNMKILSYCFSKSI